MQGELELEEELEGEYEEELEGEEFLGSVVRGIGSLLGGQTEFEEELESEYEGEDYVGAALGQGEYEFEYEGEYEGEEFFRRIARGVGRFVRRAAPVLRSVARVAAPLVGTAVGGPLGGIIGRVASQALGEEEYEYEEESAIDREAEMEAERAPITAQGAVAELMAAVASRAQSDDEAEAMIGASTSMALSPADRAALRRVLPHIVRGTAILTRILRRRRCGPAVRCVPTIVRRTATALTRRAAAGQPVTRRTAARVMASQTRRVLGSPRTAARAMTRNVAASRTATRSARRTPAARPSQRRVMG